MNMHISVEFEEEQGVYEGSVQECGVVKPDALGRSRGDSIEI